MSAGDSRLLAAGYTHYGFVGGQWLTPSGQRIVTTSEALAALEAEAESREQKESEQVPS